MNKIVLTLVISALTFAASAHGSDQTSLLQCGVKLGGKYHSYKPASEQKKSWDTRLEHIEGAAKVASLRLASFDSGKDSSDIRKTAQPNTVDTRLPPKFTFATLGCSWR